MTKKLGKHTPINPLETLATFFREILIDLLEISKEDFNQKVNIDFGPPPQHIEADYSFSLYVLQHQFKLDLGDIALRVCEQASFRKCQLIDQVFCIGPYVNIKLNKEAYIESAFEYFSGENFFGNSKNTEQGILIINTPQPRSRTCFVTSVLQNVYNFSGYKTYIYQISGTVSAQDALAGENIVSEMRREGLAHYISNTRATLVSITESQSQHILQKNDGSFTNYAIYLTHLSKVLSETRLREMDLVWVAQSDFEEDFNSIKLVLQKMNYLPKGNINLVKVAPIIIEYEPTPIINNGLAYTFIRRPLNKQIQLITVEENLEYNFLIETINKLSSASGQKSVFFYMDIVALLLVFRNCVRLTAVQGRPEILSSYLERLAKLSEEKGVYDSRRISLIVADVLESGLRLLTSAALA